MLEVQKECEKAQQIEEQMNLKVAFLEKDLEMVKETTRV